MTKQLLVDGRINIEIDYNDFLGFDEMDVMDKRFLPQLEQMIEEQIEKMTEELVEQMTEELIEQMTEELIEQMTGELTEEQTPISLQNPASYDNYNNIYNSHNSSCNMYDEGPSTSAEAARKQRNGRLQPTGDQHEFQAEAESVVPDIEALGEGVRKLTSRGKVVTLHFDEMYSNQTATYSRCYSYYGYLKFLAIYTPVSAENVRTAMKNVRRNLQWLEKGLCRRTLYCAYLWYGIGLMRAAEAISKLIEEKKFFEEEVMVNAGGASIDELAQDLAAIKTNMSNTPSFEKSLGECMQVFDKDCQGPSTSAPSVEERMQMIDEDFDGQSTSAQAAQIRENRWPRTESLFRQTTPNTEGDCGEEVLRDVLTIHDRIVQVHFANVFTNLKTIYSRKEDVLRGCAFAARSLLTSFNILLNAYPCTSYTSGSEVPLDVNLQAAEDIGLYVKAVVCDRSSVNKRILGGKFTSGVDRRKRADGSTHLIRLLYDYPS
uniref:Uncharacterized protein n=1 Tax=Glossina palpalis gambiensis TaxID=67801 RepID=A0A1B0BLG9_9MUSC